MKVENLINNNNNKVANQFRITDDEGNQFFQSYESIICKVDNNGEVTLDSFYWDYSVTTSRHRNNFLNTTTKEIKAKIESGEYKLANLN
jgi:anti-sigma28 factor (negative regulator of flagellin synthesis)